MNKLDERRREINNLIKIISDINKRVNILEERTAELHTLLYKQKKEDYLSDKDIRKAFSIQNDEDSDVA